MEENKIECFECGKKYNSNEIETAICKKCDKKFKIPINKKIYFGVVFTLFIICGIFLWEISSTFLIGLCIGLLLGKLTFIKTKSYNKRERENERRRT